jgi:serine/threonine protein kinase
VKLEAAQEWGSKLEHEYHVYRATSGIRGIPKMLWYGVEGRYNVMVLSRLGCTFEEMAQLGVLDANAVFTYAKQMVFSPCARSTLLFTSHSKLSVLKSLHDHHYVHLDVKPDNFMIGTGDRSSRVFLIDFGLTRLFRNPATRKHITQFKGLDITGTVRYSSINSHLGLTQSQRDDLESLAYAIVYLVKGRLPWQGIAVHPGQVHHDEVLKLKQVTTARPFVRVCHSRLSSLSSTYGPSALKTNRTIGTYTPSSRSAYCRSIRCHRQHGPSPYSSPANRVVIVERQLQVCDL